MQTWKDFFLNTQSSLLAIISEDNKIKGFALYAIDTFENQAHLLKVSIDSNYRGHGLGNKVLASSNEELAKQGVNNIYLEVSVENAPAIRLYEKMGFQRLCRKKKFYSNGEDAYAMQCFFK